MKLCIHCKWYGGVALGTGKYVCVEPRNNFTHPVDGLPHAYDATWLRMAPELQGACGIEGRWWEEKKS